VDDSFESRVWTKALDRGLLSTTQINDCLKEFKAESPTLQLTEILLAKGYLKPDQVAKLRGEVAISGPPIPDEVRLAARDSRNLLGRYVLLSELGRGGMGIVHKAWDGDLRRFVALKVLSGPWTADDLARFRREAQSAAALRHPNIITVYEIGPSDETPYISLELIDGKSLHGRKYPSRKAADLLVVIARAVEAAHRKGIIHRDLKPANIMIDADGRPRVMDFGLAKPERSSSQITLSGTVVGTPAYMSPEQAQGRRHEIDHRSDIYSLGALLYELLTGQAPFRGSTPLETLTAVVDRPPVPPRRITPSVPRPLEAIILMCLNKDKMRRYATAEALARDLERFLRGEPVQARHPRSPAPWIISLSAAAAFAVAVPFLFRSPPPPEAPPRPRPVPAAPVKVVDRNQLDRGLRLMEESRLDLYRAGASLDQTQGRLQEAERCLDEALKIDPASGEAYLARAEARSRLHRRAAALPDYEEAIRRLPTSPSALLSRGHVLLENFMNERATASWMKGELPAYLLADRDQARADFSKARDLSPSKNELAFLQVCLDIAEERYDQAIQGATAAIPAAEHPEEFYKLRGDAHAIRAMEGGAPQGRAEDLGRSVLDFSEAIRLRPNYAEACRWRGAAQWLLGRTQESMADFQAVLRMNPSDSLALGDMGTAYHKANKDDLALDFFGRAIAADPDNLRALTNRGSILLQEGRLVDARRDLERAIQINPRHLAAQYNLSVALYKQGELNAALQRLDEILERQPKFVQALAIRGVVNAELSRWEEGLEDCERAVALDRSFEAQLRPSIEKCRKRLGR